MVNTMKPSIKSSFSLHYPLLILTIITGMGIVVVPSLLTDPLSKSLVIEPQVGGVTTAVNVEPIEISLSQNILLKENTLDPTTGVAELRVRFVEDQIDAINEQSIAVEYHIVGSGIQSGQFEEESATIFQGVLSAEELEPGKYSVIVTVGEWQSEPIPLTVSYPLYVTWTFDWEGYDVKNEYLDSIAKLSETHDNFPLTHFFNPRIYTNPELSQERAAYLTNWVLSRANKNNDAIGLHLHMQPDMVQAAGVTVREDAAKWGSSLHDGYDVLTSEYSYDDMVKMLEWSKNMFTMHRLPSPIMYRTGGWFADEEVLRAVHDTGFMIDSSARTAYAFGKNNVSGHWNIQPDQGPYRLNLNDQNDIYGTSRLWEFPNSGADSWAFSTEQIIERFTLQYDEVLYEPRVVTFLSHPEWFHVDAPKMEQVLTHTDGYLHSQNSGNVVYATLDDVYTVWQDR